MCAWEVIGAIQDTHPVQPMSAAHRLGARFGFRLLQNSWQGGLPLFPSHVWRRGLLGSLPEGR